MKVSLIYPNNDRFVNRGTGFIAARVIAAGHALTFYDTAYTPAAEAAQAVVADRPALVLMSVSSLLWPQARRIAERIKSALDVPLLMGGMHPTIVKGEILQECSAVDYICVGEGEEFVGEFLAALPDVARLRKIANLGYRDDGGRSVVNPPRPCTDLRKLPKFPYRIFRQESIVREGPKPGFTYVYATRGCPYRCSYCCNSYSLALYGRNYLRTQNPDAVIAELLELKAQHGAKFFYFGDEMILFDEEYVARLFRRVRREVGLPFGCMVRIENITPAAVELFHETGCSYISVGIECGDEQFRRQYLNRRMTNRQIAAAFKLLRTVPGMYIYAFFMYGFPVSFDDRLTEQTRRLCQLLSPDLVQNSVFCPLPGTRLYDYCRQRDLIDADKYRQQEDYLHKSVLKQPIPPELDCPLYR